MQDNWAKWISITEFADNDGTSASTDVTLFYANKGFHPRISFSPDITIYNTTRKRLDAAKTEDITDRMQDILGFIRQNMERAQEAMITQVNRHRLDITFDADDAVFLSSKNIKTERLCEKLDDKKYGPFKVKDLMGSSYRLELPPTMRIHDVFHPKLLSLAATDPLPEQKNLDPMPIITEQGIEE